MINIGPLHPPITTPKINKTASSEAATESTEINKDAQPVVVQPPKQKKQRGKDRRQRNVKPLIDLRSSGDRRVDPDKPSINIKI